MADLYKKRDQTFWRYFDEWIHLYKENQVAPITFTKYMNTAASIKKLLPRKKMKQLDRATMQGMFNEYAQTHEHQTCMDLKRQMTASIVDAVDEGILERNPLLRIHIGGKIPDKPKRKKFLEQAELEKLIEQMDLSGSEPTMDKFLFLLSKTGLRFAEGLGLTPEDFDLDHLTLTVNKTWNYRSTKGGFMPTKTPSSVRTITIDYRTARVMDRVISGLDPKESIFAKKDAQTFNATFNRHLNILCQDAGVPEISIHGLRHTHASILIANKVPIMVVSKRLGHAEVSITENVYAHLLQTTEKESDEQIASLMSSLG